MEIEFGKSNTIPEGRHHGTIKDIDYRQPQGYHYVDIYISLDDLEGEGRTIKYGAPIYKERPTTPQSKLGKLISLFIDIEQGKKVDIEEVLMGKKVSFVTYNEASESGDGEFARIQPSSIKEYQEVEDAGSVE